MRAVFACLAVAALLTACSKPAAPPAPGAPAPAPGAAPAAAPTLGAPTAAAPAAAGPPVSGTYTASGKAAQLTEITARKGEAFGDQPVTVLIFSAKPQAGSDKPDFDVIFGKFGPAILIKVQPDGTIVEAELNHEGLEGVEHNVSLGGVLAMKDFRSTGGEISGTLTSNGPHDVFGKSLVVDLTFHVKAP